MSHTTRNKFMEVTLMFFKSYLLGQAKSNNEDIGTPRRLQTSSKLYLHDLIS